MAVTPTYKAMPPLTAMQTQAEERTACFVVRPEDISEALWATGKEVAIKVGSRLPAQVESAAFYWYYMGAGWEEMAAKLNLPIGLLVYTAVYSGWFEKKKMMKSVRAGEKVTRADAAAIDLITDTIVVTAAIYKAQLAEVVKNPSMAKECPLIPKNFKDMHVLMQMLQSLQTRDVDIAQKSGSTVNVNIANLTGNGQNSSKPYVESNIIDALPEQSEAERIEILKFLGRSTKT